MAPPVTGLRWPRGRGVRRTDGADLIEILLVVAVATVLVVRLYLAGTGYPQLSGGGFHFAHVLWGGLLMLLASLVFLGLLGRHALRFGALAAGVGFGLFIDWRTPWRSRTTRSPTRARPTPAARCSTSCARPTRPTRSSRPSRSGSRRRACRWSSARAPTSAGAGGSPAATSDWR